MSWSKKLVWSVVGAGFALNLAGLFWIRGELLERESVLGSGGEASDESLRVKAFWPKEGAPAEELDKLTVRFNRDLSEEVVAGMPLGWTPFEIEPVVKGDWVWGGRDRVEFHPEAPLPVGNRFAAKATEQFVVRVGEALRGKRQFAFETSPLRVKRCVYLGRYGKEVRLEFSFNGEVEPKALEAGLSVWDSLAGVKAGKVKALGTGPNRRQVVAVSEPPGRGLRVTLPAGFAGVAGPSGLRDAFEDAFTLKPAFAALRAWTPWRRGTEERSEVSLRFNEALDLYQDRPEVTLSPRVEDLTVSVANRGVVLRGKFDAPGRHYVATVRSDLRSADGQVLESGERFSFRMPRRSPSLEFEQSRGVLSPKGNLSLDFKVVGVSEVKLTGSRVYANNLASHLRGEADSYVGREEFSELIPVKGAEHDVKKFLFRLDDYLEEPLGLYAISAEAVERRWTNSRAVVAVTDLALTTKVDEEGVLIWVTSLSEGKPVAEAEVTVLSTTNQLLARGVTDARGLVRLEAAVDNPDGAPWLVLAGKGRDLSFRRLDQRKWNAPEFSLEGREPPKGLDAMLYAARGVRRPGESLRLTAIVRGVKGDAPGVIPVELRAYRPDGKLAETLAGKTNEAGLLHLSYEMSSESWTGSWRFVLALPGSEKTLAELSTLVEAFTPARIEVKSEPSQGAYGLAEAPEVALSARYLFGVAGADMEYRVTGEWTRATYVPEPGSGLEGFSFEELEEGVKRVQFTRIEGKTDGTGKAVVFPASDLLAPGLWEGKGYLTVTSPGGASVSDSFRLRKFAASRLVGVRVAEGGTTEPGKPFVVELVAVAPGWEKPLAGDVEVKLEKLEHRWDMRRVNDSWTWQRVEQAFEEASVTVRDLGVTPGEEARLTFTCAESGDYRVVARDLAGGSETLRTFRVAAPGETGAYSASPHRVELKPGREAYRPGEVASVAVEAPFAGEMLVTVESNRLTWSETFSLVDKETKVEVPLPEHMPGGAFVTVSVTRPLDFSSPDWKPHRAFGVLRVKTDFSARHLPLELGLPAKVEPGGKVTVKAKVKGAADRSEPVYVHLWAVDEGVLSLTDYETPDPAGVFYAPWRSKVDTGDSYLELLPDHIRPLTMDRFGAGGGAVRRSLVPAKPKKTVMLWREFASVDENGELETTFDLPQNFTGELRFLAVAVAGNAYGYTEEPVAVTAPLLAEASLPSFVAPGDRFFVPVTLFNTSDTDVEARLRMSLSGPARFLFKEEAPLLVVAGGKAVRWYELEAEKSSGVVEFSFEGRAGELVAKATGSLPVRPAATLDAVHQTFTLEAGRSRVLAVSKRFLPMGLKRTVTVSSLPTTDLRPALENLLSFPYGCVEQTTSRAMPMAYAGELLGGDKAEFAKAAVEAAVDRLASMQTRSGGLAYWPGGREPYLWGTCYATSFLMEAKGAGYEVNERFTDGLALYLRDCLLAGECDLVEQAFVCQALATFGKPETNRQRYLLDQVNDLDLAARARLAAAWLASGRADLARKCLPEGSLNLKVKRTTGGRLTSQTAAEAALLSVLLDLDARHPWVSELQRRLVQARLRNGGSWRSTLDNGLAVVALCKLQAEAEHIPANFSGEVSGPEDSLVFRSEGTSEKTFSGTGDLQLRSTGSGKLYVSVLTEGLVEAEAVEPVNEGLEVARRWTTADGRILRDWNDQGGAPVKLQVGDLVRVEVFLKAPGGRTDNVAVVDALPGGLAVENPRLATSAAFEPATRRRDERRPDRVEFLDDRVLLFASAHPEPSTFSYSLRAVAAGEFLLPPAQASCMYDESQRSLGGIGKVIVTAQ